jgi:hypothetical protein
LPGHTHHLRLADLTSTLICGRRSKLVV